MQKAADAFRTISEVADDLALPQHVLRFWETRFPQIRPLKRAGGRRYYRPTDVTLLRAIRQLLYDDGYTIKGVQRLLKEQGAKGLGAGTRAVDDGDTADAVAVIGAFDPDEMADSTDLPRGEDERPAGGMSAAPFVRSNRDTIAEVFATIEECRRLLAHAMKSTD